MKVLVYIHAGTPAEAAVTEELVTLAHAIAPGPAVVATGAAAQAVAEIAREHGAHWVGTGGGALERWQSDAAAAIVAAVLADRAAPLLLAPQRRFERDALGSVAARAGLPVLSDCVGTSDGLLRFQGAAGDVGLALDALEPVAVTVLPWTVTPRRDPGTCVLDDVGEGPASAVKAVAETAAGERPAPALHQADAVVAGGRGLLRAENMALLERLAEQLPDSALGASAAIVTDEWVPKALMVGKTGARIEPHVYVAVGISGSFFHESNTRASRYLLTVNRDEQALLPERADLCLVGDATELVSALTAQLES